MYRFILLSLYVSSIWATPSIKHSKIHPNNLTGPRIVNGQEAKLGQFPWQVGLIVSGEEGSWFCGGSIISEEWILTAGHCVDGGQSGQVISGSLSPRQGTVSGVAQFVLHERYNGKRLSNDIGLIKLTTPLKFDDNTAPVALSSDDLEAGVDVTVSGWGLTSDDSDTISPSLNYVELVTITNSDCNNVYGQIGNEMVCANSPSNKVKSTCSGDSGGPVVVNADSNPVHVAIVSFVSDEGCESGAPSGYTRTATFRSWIKEKTGV